MLNWHLVQLVNKVLQQWMCGILLHLFAYTTYLYVLTYWENGMRGNSKFKKLVIGVVFSACVSMTTANAAIIELALVIDGSGSISRPDFALQTGAYNNIFSNNFLDNFVNQGDTLYAAAYQFSSSSTAALEIGWTLIDSNAAAAAFGGMFPGISQQRG